MTAVMRALAAPDAQKILRVAMLQGGRIVEERIFRERNPISVGPSETSTFVAGARSWVLFDVAGGAYRLRLGDGVRGRVATTEGTFDLEALQRSRDELRLDPSARGRVVLGDVTFLFQFVAPPPPQPRPQLPLSVRGNREVDWAITIVVAFSFLVHFGVIGSMYSDWLDPIVADDAVVGIVDMTRSLPAPTVEDATPLPSATAPSSSGKSTSTPSPARDTRADGERRAASLAREGQAMGIQLLVAFGGTSAVEGALRRSDQPIDALDEAAKSASGATPTNELTLAHGGVTTPGHGDLRDLGVTHATGTDAHGTERPVEGPRFTMTLPPLPDPPNLLGADRAIARLRPSYRSCYVNKGLSQDPSMAGKLVISVRVAPNGDVADVHKVSGSGLSSDVEQCIMQRTHNAEFEAPGGSGATLQVPIIFEHQ